MDFQTAVRTCLQNYATFSGRARRAEFWWFALFILIGSVLLGLIDSALFGVAAGSYGVLSGLFSLAILIPSIAVSVRRLHDIDRTGWWYLLIFVPVVGFIVLLIFYIQPGTRGQNTYGPDPIPA